MTFGKFLEPKSGQKGQKWPPCDQITLANWILYMNLHFNWRKNFGCGGHRATILSVSELLSVNQILILLAGSLSHHNKSWILCQIIINVGEFLKSFVIRAPKNSSPNLMFSPILSAKISYLFWLWCVGNKSKGAQ